MDNIKDSQKIKSYALELGFSDCKITPALNIKKTDEYYQSWIANGNHGQMEYLVKHATLKVNPKQILPNAKSIILVSLNYYQKRTNPGNKGQIARYAHGRDYHKVFKNKLTKLDQFLKSLDPNASTRFFADSGPLLEREYAKQANLGYTGKNTMLITPKFGSWVLIGEIITNLKLDYDKFNESQHGICGTCTRCLTVCPTGALKNEYQIDAKLCISYLTIENKGPIPLELRPKIGDWLFGCDLCQEVCPHNFRQKQTNEPEFNKAIAGHNQDLQKILELKSEQEFVAWLNGSPLIRAKLTGLQRNACVVAGNLKLKNCLPALKAIVNNPNQNTMVQEHAQWAINQINL